MNTSNFSDIDTILFDLDGVLYEENSMIEHADTTLSFLAKKGFKIAGVTNTTTQSRQTISHKLASMHIPLNYANIYTPATLVKAYIGQNSASFFVHDNLRDDLKGITENNTSPDYIVMGDMGDKGYKPDTLHDIFRMAMTGSKLLALHKNRFWKKSDGLYLDLGAFVTAIEYASGQTATILGKPSINFFQRICISLNSEPDHTLMVGDDIESDIAGAKHAGIRAALVQTGKYHANFVAQTGIQADAIVSSVTDIPSLLAY